MSSINRYCVKKKISKNDHNVQRSFFPRYAHFIKLSISLTDIIQRFNRTGKKKTCKITERTLITKLPI